MTDFKLEESFSPLRKKDLDPNPFTQFGNWYNQALGADLIEPTGMTLATAGKNGVPSARVVLLKGYDERGFVFFTNYESPKGRELAENPNVCLNFFWAKLERQIRINGVASKVAHEESETYFKSRPIGSQMGAWASRQSSVLRNREELVERLQQVMARYPDGQVPLPPHWGGYRVVPSLFEFWQGRPNRLHDRFLYTKAQSGVWKLERLSP